jgi:hypothetical protein
MGGGRVSSAARKSEPEEVVIVFVVMSTIIIVGLAAMWLAQPPSDPQIVVWNDEAERRMLRERRVNTGWW